MFQKSSFDWKVRELVSRIPSGKLATYGQIAELIGSYGYARQVGWSLSRLPLPSSIPWHRVVNARGQISMSLRREGSDWIQRDLLLSEGIQFDINSRVSLKQYLWRPEIRDLLLGQLED